MAQMSREAFTRNAVAAGLALALAHSLDGAQPAMARDIARDLAPAAQSAPAHGHGAHDEVLRALMVRRHIAGVSFNRHGRPGPTGHVITIAGERVWVDYGERARDTAMDLVERAGAGTPFVDMRSGIYGRDAHGTPHVIVFDEADGSRQLLAEQPAPYVTLAGMHVHGMPGSLENQRLPVFHPTREQAVEAARQIDRTISRDALDRAYTDAALNRADRVLSGQDRDI